MLLASDRRMLLGMNATVAISLPYRPPTAPCSALPLQVFRSVISYNRFWEGRGHLGAIMADARDFARQVAFSITGDEGHQGVKDIKRLEQAMHGEGYKLGEGAVRQLTIDDDFHAPSSHSSGGTGPRQPCRHHGNHGATMLGAPCLACSALF